LSNYCGECNLRLCDECERIRDEDYPCECYGDCDNCDERVHVIKYGSVCYDCGVWLCVNCKSDKKCEYGCSSCKEEQ
jgi:hypothetical protein